MISWFTPMISYPHERKQKTLILNQNWVGSCAAKKPTDELTKADLKKVTNLFVSLKQLTDVSGLENLTQLTSLTLVDNPDLTKAQIDQLQKALPNCKIISDPTK